ncbi:putative short-chain dehydrogenase [Truncatella angustata]|uniref:Short-chain dehydrogenase n=1 Tax=Truncatella angustata TaxID=152316 RepID=A0A9P8UKR5_9PEZI|nr:putative short-chain dehydrogenase [Truncatella angustata]KAH6653790.1 putative short-chain dehydrogenase [Truncatella angustata]KAH8194517.1 hypothetical protein TruAng_011316 [Truncatella angustata]
MDPGNTTNFTSTVHRTSYDAISSSRKELDKTHKTVLITGGATGIGKAIAHSFIAASATAVIIVGRRVDVLREAAAELEKYAREAEKSTKIITRSCNVASTSETSTLWDEFASAGITVDVLVSNAAKFTEPNTMFELGIDEIWTQFETNVKGPMFFAERFYKQPGDDQRFLVNVTSQVIHQFYHPIIHARPAYSLTKASGTLAYQLLANSVAPDRLQIVSFHPGLIFGAGLEAVGLTKDMLPFDEVELPGDFAVWAASKEAEFLHGRFVWASWDVVELSGGAIRERIDRDPYFLRVGVVGLEGSNRA